MKVFFATVAAPDNMPPLQLSPSQITAGHNYPTALDGEGARSLRLPFGSFRLLDGLRQHGLDGWADLTVVHTYCSGDCLPDLAGIAGRKLLILADTHREPSGLSDMIGYARSQPFDAVAMIHDPHHMHWAAEAGLANLTFIPNYSVQDFGLSRLTSREEICFYGRLTNFHPRRGRMLEALQAAGLPMSMGTVTTREAAEGFSTTRIAFNCSMNGDLNMRFFEVLAAGGFLLTDRLPPQSSVHTMFTEGEDFIAYSSPEEAVELARRFLADPDACDRIAARGQATYRARHTPDIRRRELLDLAFEGKTTDYVTEATDGRLRRICDFGRNLDERMRSYEFIQERILVLPKLDIACDPAIGARTISDMVDLPQMRVHVLPGPGDTPALAKDLEALGVGRQVLHGPLENPADILVLHRSSDMVRIAGEHPRARLIIVHGAKGDPLKVKAKRLAALGYADIGAQMPIFFRETFPIVSA